MTEYTNRDENALRDTRRAFINQGRSVSLMSYDGSRDLYVFDLIS